MIMAPLLELTFRGTGEGDGGLGQRGDLRIRSFIIREQTLLRMTT